MLAAGHAARGVPSSIQAEKRELRLGDRQWDRDLGLGSDRRSAALFVLVSWRVLCVCCNQITNDHKKYSSSSSSALRCVFSASLLLLLLFLFQCPKRRACTSKRDPPILLADQAQLVSLVLVFGLLVDSIRFISFLCVVLLLLLHALFCSCFRSSNCCIFLLTCCRSLPLMS